MVMLLVGILRAGSAGAWQANPRNEPQIAERRKDETTGQSRWVLNEFDTIVQKDNSPLYVEIDWCPRPTDPGEWRSVKDVLVRPFGKKQGKVGVSRDDIVKVVYWEQQALEWARSQINERGDLDVVDRLLQTLRTKNPAWRPSERDGLALEIRILKVQGAFDQRHSSTIQLATALRELEQLLKDEGSREIVRRTYIDVHVKLGEEALVKREYQETRDRRNSAEKVGPRDPATARLIDSIKVAVRQLQGEAERADVENDYLGALRSIDQAMVLAGGDVGVRKQSAQLYIKYQPLIIGCFEPATKLDPTNSRSFLERIAGRLVFESLFERGPHTSTFIQGPLVEHSKDSGWGRQFDVTLQAGVRFSDGQVFGAPHIQQSLEKLRAPDVQVQKIRGPYELTLSLPQRTTPLELLTFPVFAASARTPDRLIGTGPFAEPTTAVAQASEYETLRLVRNPEYREVAAKRPYLPGISFNRYAARTTGTAVNDLEKGNLHMLFNVSPLQLARLQNAAASFEVRPFQSDSVWVLALNHDHRPLSERADNPGKVEEVDSDAAPRSILRIRELRRAMLQAIRRQDILNQYFVNNVRNVHHKVITGPFPPHSPNYDSKITPEPLNLDAARTSVTNWKQKSPQLFATPLQLVFLEGEQVVEDAMNQVKKDLEAVGFRAQSVGLPRQEYYQRVFHNHLFDIAYVQINHESVLQDLREMFSRDDSAVRPGGKNFMHYRQDNELWEVLKDVATVRTGQELISLQNKVHRRLNSEVVLIPLWWLENHLVFTSRLKARSVEDPRVPVGKVTNVEINPTTVFQRTQTWFLEPRAAR